MVSSGCQKACLLACSKSLVGQAACFEMMMLPRSPEVAGLRPINAESHSEVINIFVNLLNPHFLTEIPPLYTATT